MKEQFDRLWADVHTAMTPHADEHLTARKLWDLGYRPSPSEHDDRDTLLRLLCRYGVPTEYQAPIRRSGW